MNELTNEQLVELMKQSYEAGQANPVLSYEDIKCLEMLDTIVEDVTDGDIVRYPCS